MIIHKFINKLIAFFAGSLARNKRYERLIEAVIKKECRQNSLCIDVGANDGLVLQLLIKHCPGAMHYAFETDDRMYFLLVRKFGSAAHIYKFIPNNHSNKQRFSNDIMGAGGNQDGNQPAKDLPELETLDSIIPPNEMVRLIKINLENDSDIIILGAKKIIERCKPVILFFFTSDSNFITHQNVFNVLASMGMQVNYFNRFLMQEKPLTNQEMKDEFTRERKHYFIAYPKNRD